MYLKQYIVLMLMIKRQLFNSISINIYLSSLKYMHISIANALLNTAPIISYFVKVFFYKVIVCLNRSHYDNLVLFKCCLLF